jgi:hypothetical protein
MSFSIVDYDPWPRVSVAIEAERARRMGDLLHVATIEGMRKEQGFIEALDWVLDQALTKPAPKHDEESE